MKNQELQILLVDAACSLANPDQPRPERECAELALRLLMASKDIAGIDFPDDHTKQ